MGDIGPESHVYLSTNLHRNTEMTEVRQWSDKCLAHTSI